MLNEFHSSTEKYSTLLFYIVFLLFFLFGFWYVSIWPKKSGFKTTLLIIFIVSIISTLIIFLQALFPQSIFNQIASVTVGTILPICFFTGGLGITIYGVAAILKRETFVKFAFIPAKVKGVEAIYFGILWVFCGLMMIVMTLYFSNLFLCEKNLFFCQFNQYLDNSFGFLGKIVIFLYTPIQFLKDKGFIPSH